MSNYQPPRAFSFLSFLVLRYHTCNGHNPSFDAREPLLHDRRKQGWAGKNNLPVQWLPPSTSSKAIWNSFGVHISGTWRWCLTGVESAHSLPTLTQACVRRRFFPFFNMFIIYICYIYIYIFHCFTIYLIFFPDSPTHIFLGHPRTLALAAPGPFISEILERPACLCVYECARKKARKGGENPEQFGELFFVSGCV